MYWAHFWLPILVVPQEYLAEADNEHVILGNAAIVKCEIPSFVADFVRVTSWIDETTSKAFYYSKQMGNKFCFGTSAYK